MHESRSLYALDASQQRHLQSNDVPTGSYSDLVPFTPFLLISPALVLAREAVMRAAALAGQEECPRLRSTG